MVKRVFMELDYGRLMNGGGHKQFDLLSSATNANVEIIDYGQSYVDAYRDGCVLTYIDAQSHRTNTLRTIGPDFVDFVFLQDGQSVISIGGEQVTLKHGHVLVLFNADDVTITNTGATHTSGIHLKVRRQALLDDFALDPQVLPVHARAALLGAIRQPVKLVVDLRPRAAMALEDIYPSTMKGKLFRRFVQAKAEELVCQLVGSWNAQATTRIGSLVTPLKFDEIIAAAAYIYRQRIGSPLSVEELSRMLGVNKNRLTFGFRERFGLTPGEYARVEALRWAKEQLEAKQRTVKATAALSGYADISSFSRAFKAHFGVPPSQVVQLRPPVWP